MDALHSPFCKTTLTISTPVPPTPSTRPISACQRIIQDVRPTLRASSPRLSQLLTWDFPRRATELTVQSERAFQKQPHIFLNSKVKTKTTRPGKGGRRWYKDVGLGFRTPKTAIEGSYIGTFWKMRKSRGARERGGMCGMGGQWECDLGLCERVWLGGSAR